jgi:anti-sigma factor RsiW
MNCEQIAELLPDYLQGISHPEQGRIVEQHLELCAECREEVAIWKKLSLLPVEEPSPASRARFEAMVQAYQAGRSDPSAPIAEKERAFRWPRFPWFRSPVAGLAWALVLLGIGIFAGNYMSRSHSHSEELAAMHSELTNMRQLVVLSMLQNQSATERLQGVTWSRREEQINPQILSALLRTLRYDGSVDVRLAALDALSRHTGDPEVHTGLVNSLQPPQSPLVQVALIDLLVESRDPGLAERLRNFQKSPNLNPTVRQRVEWALSKVN